MVMAAKSIESRAQVPALVGLESVQVDEVLLQRRPESHTSIIALH